MRPSVLALFTLGLLLVISGCSDGSSNRSSSGIPVSELPSRKSLLTREAIALAVRERFPADTYMTNAYLPKAGDFESYTASAPAEARTIRVGMPWVRSDGFSPLYIGIEKGFFEAVGLKIEMVAGGPGRDHLQTLVGGQVDFAITADGMNLPVFAASRTSGDVVGLASFLKKNPVAYLSLDASIPSSEKSSAEVTYEDFNDSAIGVLRGRTHYVEFLVDHFKMDPDRVRVRWTGSTPDALITGVVDHWAAWILDQPRLLEQNGYHNWRPFFFHDLGWKQYCDIVVTRRPTLESDPEMVRRFLAALDRALDFYFANPDESAEITSRYAIDVNFTPEDVKRRYAIEHEIVRGDDGLPLLHMDPVRWNEVTTTLIQYGMINDENFR